eukprot:TRINITY_DN5_c0_g1_i5.p1 TRINITY_DN5_c0_g1~~TRINITY_DN5_c0_g1_i5.p1  ORF type:complete len:209 (+),score=37.09 TRINITY_DN5_c0_g1_i5:271-897(+)
MAATSAFSDRIKIARNAQFPDINIAPQNLISCDFNEGDMGCEGGAHLSAFKYMHDNNVTDETCSIYRAKGWTNGQNCSDEIVCQNCWSGKGCWAQQTYHVYRVDQYGFVNGSDQMMNEIYQRGPITCSLDATQEFYNYTGGIFIDKSGSLNLDHAISLVQKKVLNIGLEEIHGEHTGVKEVISELRCIATIQELKMAATGLFQNFDQI